MLSVTEITIFPHQFHLHKHLSSLTVVTLSLLSFKDSYFITLMLFLEVFASSYVIKLQGIYRKNSDRFLIALKSYY